MLDKKAVYKIAKLARIRVTESDADRMQNELNNILGMVEQLQSVNTDGVPEMAGVGNYSLRMRRDEVSVSSVRDELLSVAPASAFECYTVPKVVE